MKKTVYGLLLAAIIIVIFFLTFQDPVGTVKLSEGLRHGLEHLGIKMSFHSIRSNAHLVLYFGLGVLIALFGRGIGWKWWTITAAGCLIGLIDEGIKTLLPTREFDIADLLRDWAGIILGTALILFIRYKKQIIRSEKGRRRQL